ncbi:hypothetical protein PROSTU_04820 [Providencia stuartii ATCC 25827]|uniref:Uncharacterized protein n=1 Tax=Providencia stuartii ATCC 25827 TaxID=471874 RepID=A0AA86YHB2_PROST|nr:hypothetical protein PROSTU_04820 [Providencia stuartii ATCC 25827]
MKQFAEIAIKTVIAPVAIKCFFSCYYSICEKTGGYIAIYRDWFQINRKNLYVFMKI